MKGPASILRQESAPVVGILQAATIYLIYQHQLPSNADLRGASPYNSNAEVARKQAAWEAAALIGIVFAVTRDLTAFIIGGVALIAVDSSYKHANAVHPQTGRVDVDSQNSVLSGPHSLPDYQDDAA